MTCGLFPVLPGEFIDDWSDWFLKKTVRKKRIGETARCWHVCAQLRACIGFSLSLKFTLDGQCMCLSSRFLEPFHFLLTDINKYQKAQTIPSKLTRCSLTMVCIHDRTDWSSLAALALKHAAVRRQSLNTATVVHFKRTDQPREANFLLAMGALYWWSGWA